MTPRRQWSRAVPVSAHRMTSPRMKEVHERLIRFGSEPVPDADAGWEDLRAQLPHRRLSWAGRGMAWLRRPAVAIMTTGLLSTGVAHAAGVQPVRGGVDWLVGGVTSIVGGNSAAHDEPDARGAARPRASGRSAGPSEENRRRLSGGAGLGQDGANGGAPAGEGRPARGGTGSDGDEGGDDQQRDQDRDRRDLEDRNDNDELDERDDRDEEGIPEPDDDDVDEPDDDEAEEPDDQVDEPDDDEVGEPDDRATEVNRDIDEEDHLDGDSYDKLEPEEDRGAT